jgi:nucleotide-binding universal stress UspA family protein
MTAVFDNAVVGVRDLTRGRDALELARALVSDSGRIALVYVECVATAAESLTGSDAERQRFGLARLERLRDQAGIAADVSRVQAESVQRGLHRSATERGADLIVIGARRARPLAHMLAGDDVREVLDDPPCAVAVAPIGYRAEAPLGTIGVAYDGSPESERALAVARQLAADSGATVESCEAAGPPPQAVEELRRYGASVDLLVAAGHNHRLAEDPKSPLLVLGPQAQPPEVSEPSKRSWQVST